VCVVQVSTRLKVALASNRSNVISLFQEWDEDGNGVIDRDEFANGMRAIAERYNVEAREGEFQGITQSFHSHSVPCTLLH
jgi:Ca2+-binding EF-hand superfamily protein